MRPRALPSDAGVTLTEIMVVLFILGLASSVIIMSAPDRPDPLEEEAGRLVATLRTAQDVAITSGRMVGFDARERSYEIMTRTGGAEWRVRREFGRTLPEEIALDLDIDDLDIVEDVPQDWPELLFDPLGGATPAVFTLRSGDETQTVRLDPNGDAVLERADEA
ncbi:MAG: GspH/FimT family pseudopilin [Pseudomonadota bacterium]